MNIGTLLAQIGLDHTKLMVGAREAESRLTSLSSNVRMAATGITASLGAMFSVATIHKAIEELDKFEMSVIKVSAMLTTMQGPKDVAEHYKENYKYASMVAEKLEEWDAKSAANGETLQTMNEELIKAGVRINTNNKSQEEGFIALSNALAVYTAGQNASIQAHQEMRSLLSGQVNMNSQLAMQMDSLIRMEGQYKGGLKEATKEWMAQGTWLEHIQKYLIGFVAASGDMEKTWTAVSSTLETKVAATMRTAIKPVWEDLREIINSISDGLEEHNTLISTGVYKTWLSIKGVVETVGTLFDQQNGSLRALVPIGIAIWNTVKMIADGWGMIASVILPTVAEKLNNIVEAASQMALGMANMLTGAGQAATQNFKNARREWGSIWDLSGFDSRMAAYQRKMSSHLEEVPTPGGGKRNNTDEKAEREAERRAKHIAQLNKQLAEQNEEYGKSELEMIALKGQRYLAEGRSRVLVEQWVANETDKIQKSAMSEAFKKLDAGVQQKSESDQQRLALYQQISDELLELTGRYEEAAKARWEYEQSTAEFQALSPDMKAKRGQIAGIDILQGRQRDTRDFNDVQRMPSDIRNSIPDSFGNTPDNTYSEYQRRSEELDMLIELEEEKYGMLTANYQAYLESKKALDEKYTAEKMSYQAQFDRNMQSQALAAAEQGVAILKQAAGKNKGVMLAALVIEKGIAIARIMMNAAVARSAALASAAMFGPAAPAVYAANEAMIDTMMAVNIALVVASGVMEAAQIMSGKASGGPVSSGKVYPINERGTEMFSSGGKDYLLTGDSNGYITPADKLGGKMPKIVIEDHGTKKSYETKSLTEDEVRLIARDVVDDRAPRVIASEFDNANSRVAKSANRNLQAPRRNNG